MLIKYFHIFRHPLRFEEILKYSCEEQTAEQLELYLEELVSAEVIKKSGHFYLYDGDEQYIGKRLNGEVYSARLIPQAAKVAQFIARFPFVRFVGISGSLSKGYADQNTDFDFFIITAANTLWICRTLLHIAKKLSFLLGKQHWMCMNYFIDEEHLEIEEQNIFTQIELSTLIPVYNQALHRQLLLHNRKTLPNLMHLGINFEDADDERELNAVKIKNKWWKPLNTLLMKLTDRKWKKKWKRRGYPMEDYSLAFKTTPYISKNHPKNYQKNILKQLQANQF